QFVYLVRIYEHPGIIARDLAKLILMDKTTIARAVAKLEKNSLIVRRSDPANHRIKRMYVTKKGAELYP
ncbi:MarR family transcriptional regulator, partial [Eggerthella lenta]|nr:MarR family transcriptional regulator [Eggerthella lenta]